jgi:2'-hydroxyisoflavone reductase
MRVLVLGGGGFLGYHAVAAALAAGHEVTVLSRSGKAPLDGVEALRGDRTGDLGALRGREWDAVLDTYTGADAVRATAELLRGSVGTYGYVSGMSVYAPGGPAVPDETAPVRAAGREPDDDPLQERSVAKLAAEAALAEVWDGPVLVPRVGIMVGPRDPSGRFSWWPRRMRRALAGTAPRRVVGPGDPTREVQYSDARDIAGWVVGMLAAGRGGTYNTVGPGRPDRLEDVLAACLVAAGGRPGDVELVWTAEDVLREAMKDVEEEDRPLWFPEDQIPQRAIDSSKALAAGLTFRPAVDTARDVLDD